jgi:hypothetical protein
VPPAALIAPSAASMAAMSIFFIGIIASKGTLCLPS